MIKEKYPHIKVTVLTADESPNTTSDVAAGIFKWGVKSPPGSDAGQSERWALQSWSWFNNLLKEGPSVAGVSKIPAFFFSSHNEDQVESSITKKLCKVYRKCTEKELNLPQPSGKYKHGIYVHTLQMDTGIYLPYLTKRFKAAGGSIKKFRVESLVDLPGDVIVNCAGLGARSLAGDKELVPLRGQVIRVRAPWIKTCFFADDTYVIPGQNWVTVGGTLQYNDWMTEPEPNDSARIWSRAVAAFPCLAEAEIIGDMVGLRPHRNHPRIEIEKKSGRFVVHNYGHSGWGIMASPATSLKALDLVGECLGVLQQTAKL